MQDLTLKFLPAPASGTPYAITRHLDKYRPGDTLDTVLFIDGLQRVLQTKKDASIEGKPGRTVSGQVIYDAFGRSVKQYYPSAEFGDGMTALNPTEGDYFTETVYDAADRSVSVVLPDGSTTFTENIWGQGKNKFGTSTKRTF